jgi:hypothetical protein
VLVELHGASLKVRVQRLLFVSDPATRDWHRHPLALLISVYFDEDWELNGETPMDVLKSFRDDEPEPVVQEASDEAVELLSRKLEGSSSKRSWTGSGSSTTRRPGEPVTQVDGP